MTTIVVSGTGTGVGKTVVAAAILALAGPGVSYVKPVQTGVPDDVPDVDTVARLSGARCHELARYAPALSPEAAARHESRRPFALGAVADLLGTLDADLVLVEGAGGLLVRYDEQGATVADLAVELAAPVLVVTAPGLGTLNATSLTLEAMDRRGIALAGLVVGAWPRSPGLAERSNVRDLETIAGEPLAGVLPDGAGGLTPGEFREVARAGLSPRFGGRFTGVA